MIVINTVSNERFSLNGIEYFKNFLSFVYGDNVGIYNAYDKTDQRVNLDLYSNFIVNGVVYESAALLQSALLGVIYTRDTLGAVNTVLKGSVKPTDTPTGTGVAFWVATQAGTYTNFGGVIVSANSFAVISRDAAGAFSISQTTFDISSKVNVSDVVNTLTSTETTKPLSAAQGKALNENINTKISQVVISNNLGDKNTVTPLTRTDGNLSGSLEYSSDKFTTDFIPIEVGVTYFLSIYSAFTSYWSGSKVFVAGGTRNVPITQFTPPAGTAFIRLTFENANLNTFYINKGSLKSYDAYTTGVPLEKMNFSGLTTTNISDIKTKPYLKSILTKGENKIANSTLNEGLTTNHEIANDGANILPTISVTSGVKDILDNNVFNISHLRNGTTITGVMLRNFITITPSASNSVSCSFLFFGDITKLDFYITMQGYVGGSSGTNLGTFGSVGINDIAKIDILTNGWSRMYLTNVVPQSTADTISFLIRTRAKITAPDGVVQTCYISSPYLHLLSTKAVYLYNALDFLVPEMLTDQRFINGTSQSPYAVLSGKKWTSYGDSITAANTIQLNVLSKITGLTHYLRGIGGTTIRESGTIAWVNGSGLYLDRPPSSQPAGSIQILSSMSNQERINTIPLDTNIITIMGGTNDCGGTILGTIADTGTTTFYGAYQAMLNKIYIRIPNAEIILATFVHRSDDFTLVGTDGKKAEDLREAIRLIGLKYKYRVVEIGKSGINSNNHTTFLSDGIHPNSLGAERMSRLFLQEFKNIY